MHPSNSDDMAPNNYITYMYKSYSMKTETYLIVLERSLSLSFIFFNLTLCVGACLRVYSHNI